MTMHSTRRVVAAVVVAAVVAATAGCGPAQEQICQGEPENVTILAFATPSDLETSQRLAPEIATQAAQRVAGSCGTIAASIVTNTPESDLEIRTAKIEPDRQTAPDRRPFVRPLQKRAMEYLQRNLLEPLAEAQPTSGSPFLGALAKVASENQAQQRQPGTIVLIGDGIAIETAPRGGEVDFRRGPGSPEQLDEFVPLLQSLEGACVMLLGQGAESNLDAQRIRDARQTLATTLNKADINLTATRTPQIPNDCAPTR